MMKCDLHELVTRKLDWDDRIPDSPRHVWKSHFEMIQNIKGIKFNRTVVPYDAISLDINTIDTGDASHNLACAAIYARFKKNQVTTHVNSSSAGQNSFHKACLNPELNFLQQHSMHTKAKLSKDHYRHITNLQLNLQIAK